MTLNAYLQDFKNRRYDPDIVMLYKLKWAQIEGHLEGAFEGHSDVKGLRILDFGSGFGTTANHFARHHQVTAIEPNESMIQHREQENPYHQIHGSYENLLAFEEATFDQIICHNVLEFAPERAQIVREFERILRPGGLVSIVKNNNDGRILSKAVAKDMAGALKLLEGGQIANTFGTVEIYHPHALEEWGTTLRIEKHLALQSFYGLQGDHAQKHDPESTWMQDMFDLEMRVADLEPYKSISLFNHVLLRKTK